MPPFYTKINNNYPEMKIIFSAKPNLRYKPYTKCVEETYKNKVLAKRTYDEEGKETGTSYTYYGNGNIRTKNSYQSDKLHGISEYYNEKGEITKICEYNMDKLLYTKIKEKDEWKTTVGRTNLCIKDKKLIWKDKEVPIINKKYLLVKSSEFWKKYCSEEGLGRKIDFSRMI